MRLVGLILFFLLPVITSAQESEEESPEERTSIVKKNSIYLEAFGYAVFSASLNYERSFQLDEKAFLGLRGGLTYFYGIQGIAELNGFFFGPKHFLELGVGTCTFTGWHFSEDSEENDFVLRDMQPNGRIGYRYQGPKGLTIKAGPFLYYDGDEVMPLPSVSLGYSF